MPLERVIMNSTSFRPPLDQVTASCPSWRRHLTALLASLAVSLLAACGGGGDGSPPLVQGGAQIEVVNKLSRPMARAAVTSSTGAVLFDAPFRCAPGNSCPLGLASPALEGPTLIRFYDGSGYLIGAYNLVQPASGGRDTIFATQTMTGVYLFEQLAERSGIDRGVLARRIARFFEHALAQESAPDLFAELGAYHDAALAAADYAATRFFGELNTGLDQDAVLTAAATAAYQRYKMTTPEVVGANPNPPPCEPGAASVGSALENIGRLIPIPGVGQLIGGSGSLIAALCQSTTEAAIARIDERLTALEEKVNEMDAKLIALQFDMAAIATEIGKITASQSLYNIDYAYAQLKIYLDDYLGQLKPDPIYQQDGYPSLGPLLTALGGLNETTLARNGVINHLLTSIPGQVSQFSALASRTNLDALTRSLDLICKSPDGITGDVIYQRTVCNLVLMRVSTIVSWSQVATGTMLKDEFAVITAAIDAAVATGDRTQLGWLARTFGNPPTFGEPASGTQTWQKSAATADALVQRSLTNVSDAFAGKFYVPTDGLRSTLLSSMVAAQCTVEGNVQAPAVLQWFPNDAKGHPLAEPYIVSLCQNAGQVIRSSYFYNGSTSIYFDDKDDKVINALGVLVRPSDFMNWAPGYPPSPKRGLVGRVQAQMEGACLPTSCTTFAFVPTRGIAFYNAASDPGINGFITNERVVEPQMNGRTEADGKVEVMTKVAWPGVSATDWGVYQTVTRNFYTSKGVTDLYQGYVNSLYRYTDDTGHSVLFLTHTWFGSIGNVTDGSRSRNMEVSLGCLSAACDARDNALYFKGGGPSSLGWVPLDCAAGGGCRIGTALKIDGKTLTPFAK